MFEEAKKRYEALGIDVEATLKTLKATPLSVHCWQGDDVQGFQSDAALSGGIQATGNYPGKARNFAELKQDIEEAFSLMPGTKRLNLHGGNFSGGQKQRITIARALIRNPEIIIFDEATSALDNFSERSVQEAIAKATQGRTTFVIAHRISTIKGADRILYIEAGHVLEEGSYDELMAKKGRFFAMQNASFSAQEEEKKKMSEYL